MKTEIIAMVQLLKKKGIDPLYKEDYEIATVLLCGGWSASAIVDNFQALKTMAVFHFENERRKRRRIKC